MNIFRYSVSSFPAAVAQLSRSTNNLNAKGKMKKLLLLMPVLAVLFGCVSLPPEEKARLARLDAYWLKWASTERDAIRNFGPPDSRIGANWSDSGYFRYYRDVWYNITTPDGRHWESVSMLFSTAAKEFGQVELETDAMRIRPRGLSYDW
jgi:hypothetical protein